MVNKIMPLFILIFIEPSRSLHYKFQHSPLIVMKTGMLQRRRGERRRSSSAREGGSQAVAGVGGEGRRRRPSRARLAMALPGAAAEIPPPPPRSPRCLACAPGRKVGGGPPVFVGDGAGEQSCKGGTPCSRGAGAARNAARQGSREGENKREKKRKGKENGMLGGDG